MYDRVSNNPGRYKITFEDADLGEKFGVLELADDPTVEGTPLNAATLASIQTLLAAGLSSANTPNDLFALLVNNTKYDGGISVNSVNYPFSLSNSNQLYYTKFGKIVQICGAVALSGTAEARTYTLFTLPSGYRPLRTIYTSIAGKNSNTQLVIYNNGAVAIEATTVISGTFNLFVTFVASGVI